MFTLEDKFGTRLRNERIKHSYTQEQLAYKTGVSTLSISQYETGKSFPSIKFIYALEKINFDIFYIMLAVSKENYQKTYKPATYKKVAEEIDLLELKLGDDLDTEARVKLTESLLNHFEENSDKPNESFNITKWLSKIIANI